MTRSATPRLIQVVMEILGQEVTRGEQKRDEERRKEEKSVTTCAACDSVYSLSSGKAIAPPGSPGGGCGLPKGPPPPRPKVGDKVAAWKETQRRWSESNWLKVGGANRERVAQGRLGPAPPPPAASSLPLRGAGGPGLSTAATAAKARPKTSGAAAAVAAAGSGPARPSTAGGGARSNPSRPPAQQQRATRDGAGGRKKIWDSPGCR